MIRMERSTSTNTSWGTCLRRRQGNATEIGTPECEENPLQQQDRLQDRKQNRTHDGECEKFQLKEENGDQDGEKYQYKHENMDEDAKYKFNFRYKKHIGLIEGP